MTSTWVRPWATQDDASSGDVAEDDVPFEDEATEPSEEPDEPEYVFEGFDVESSHKVRLTPVELGPAPREV